jgi:anti-sigma-K factor RskA
MSATAEERDLLAAEYVLGTLDAAARPVVAASLATDAALAADVAAWERRLGPLFEDAVPVEPAPALWERIDAELTRRYGPARPTVVTRPGLWQRVETWRWATAAASLAAAILLAVLFVPGLGPAPTAPSRFAAVLGAPQAAPAWLARVTGDTLEIQPVAVAALAPDRSYELWIIPPGASAPISLGLIDPARPTRRPVTPDIRAGGTLAVSLEPRGGSPTGAPTGPVLHTGAVLESRV